MKPLSQTNNRKVTDAELRAAEWIDARVILAGKAIRLFSDEHPTGLYHPSNDMIKGERIVTDEKSGRP